MTLRELLPAQLGFGTAPLGNIFRAVSEEEADATMQAAWDNGIRFFDTAPLYGAGLAELRLGRLLAQHPRSSYVLSTKVGRLVLDEPEEPPRGPGANFEHGRPNRIVADYSAAATERSIEDSLVRLGVDRLDLVFVHDPAQDFYGDEWLLQFERARTGAFRVLQRLRDEGVIAAWGIGTNRVEPIELALELDEPRPDGFLLAGRYTLLDHSRALQRLLPTAAEQGLSVVVGGPYSSGLLAGGEHFEYGNPPLPIIERLNRIRAIGQRHAVSLKALALQFVLAHPAVAAAIPGATRPGRIAEDFAALYEPVPAGAWHDLREAGLIDPAAPTPTS